MYGLVNRAIEQLVVSLKGDAAWQRICRAAGWDDESFIALQSYDDQVTYRLVGAVSQELGIPPDQVLRAFGEYWILYTADQGYGELMNVCGSNLREFLHGMNHMHARIETSMPQMRTPHFEIEDTGEQSLRLHYHSEREGLSPMVEGLIIGLGKRFGQVVQISLASPRGPGRSHDVFEVSWTEA